jgi:16S rRNA (guanine966-N2)-methyltransferase
VRVIAGSAKGTRLAPVPAGTRPLSDRAREGLFSSLGPGVAGAAILDLYAGTGACGIEALSRGASRVTFVDSSVQAIRTIRDNLGRTRLVDRAEVVRTGVERFLQRAPSPAALCVLDPPYATPAAQVEGALARLAEGWLEPGWTVVLTRPRQGYSDVIPVNWQVARRLEYGDTLVILYREA